MDDTLRNNFILAHNNYKGLVARGQMKTPNGTLPTGRNIYKYTYDLNIEAVAQAYANKCIFAPSGNTQYGENICIGSNSPSKLQ